MVPLDTTVQPLRPKSNVLIIIRLLFTLQTGSASIVSGNCCKSSLIEIAVSYASRMARIPAKSTLLAASRRLSGVNVQTAHLRLFRTQCRQAGVHPANR